MRILPDDEHQARKEKMLQAVVHLFIRTGKPVGSSTILDSFKIDLSSATVRNVLADLEKEGFLTHPHTSAGRVPTDKGYRFYVDSIANIQRLAVEEESRIRQQYQQRTQELEELMHSTTKVLSALSQYTGFVLPARKDISTLRRLELIPVSNNQLLAVLVADSGLVRNQMIPVESLPSDETLRNASRFLNERLSGLSFSQAQGRLLAELDRFNQQKRMENEFLKSLSRILFEEEKKPDVYVEGASKLFNFPEFQDYETMRHFAQLVDEKEALGEILSRGLNQGKLQVKIGSEILPELKDLSVVASSYQIQGRPVGVLGILGPKRMPYERMMSIVNTVAQLMNQHLEKSRLMNSEEPHG